MKLALGTVQFGLPYGVANQLGKIEFNEASEILHYAANKGIDTLDTAIAYGDSEKILGEMGVTSWRVISKLPAIPKSCGDIGLWVKETVFASIKRLNLTKLYGLLIHQPSQLEGAHGEALFRSLCELKAQGYIDKIGISIYTPDELDTIWPHYQVDIVQAPYNVFDRRLATSGWMSRLYKLGVEVHVRSIFLQGLLLMENSKRSEFFKQWQPHWELWQSWLKSVELTPLQGCLAFTLSNTEIDRVIVGVDSLMQLKEIVFASEYKDIPFPDSLATNDVQLLNPLNWL